MPLKIQHLTQPSDISAAVALQSKTFSASAFFTTVGLVPLTPARHAAQTQRLKDLLATDPTFHLVGVVDEDTGDLIAMAKWHMYVGEEGVRTWRDATKEEISVPVGIEPSEAEGYKYAVGQLAAGGRRWFGKGREHCFLAVLCTDPNHQGRGAGSLLLQYGLKIADQHGVESYLEASPKGKSLYIKHGFEEITLPDGEPGQLEFDVGKYTGRGGDQGDWVRLTQMTRRPQERKN